MKFFKEGDMPDEASARRFIRMFCGGDVILTTGTGGRGKKYLHIPNTNPFENDRPLCSTSEEIDWIRKPLSVYPHGYKPFCQRCLVRAFPDRAAINVGVCDG